MPPPWATNPAPKTESAREAAKSFFCDLCQKGYSRINEFEAHEGSYDHQHKKRLKEMTRLTRATGTASTSKSDDPSSISIKPISLGSATGAGKTGGAGFKKGGFKKNAFAASEDEVKTVVAGGGEGDKGDKGDKGDRMEVDDVQGEGNGKGSEQEEWERWGDYDPRRPTGCELDHSGEWMHSL
ncbi:uncharacterized protein KY384_005562 [Bacidia gigantensis]|uniref:uncharacterized protein n=1 Tax=Bacidia gigantensis TaxID=2732470 RepID=UPI001D046CBF|nr:uncharacterized protein KY384_005562 [Bacidia gigantensis]KAG8530080.1 hypothetical protein KY384_005562 [Bacidia gigantensis]